MRKKGGMTFEEHKQLGQELKEIHAKLNKALLLVSKKYGTSKTATKRAEKVISQLNDFRSSMDSLACSEFPYLKCCEYSDLEVKRCYYGGMT